MLFIQTGAWNLLQHVSDENRTSKTANIDEEDYNSVGLIIEVKWSIIPGRQTFCERL